MLKDEKRTEIQESDLEPEEGRKPLEFKWISRYRWNVLDLLRIFAKKAITCHMFCDIDMSRVNQARARMDLEHHHVTITSFLLKAIAIAQIKHPESRTVYLPDARLVTFENIVAGITVERKVNGQPIVFFAEIAEPHKKSIDELNQSLRQYADAELLSVPKLKEQKMFAEMPWLVRRIILGCRFPSLRLRFQSATFGLSSLGALGISVAGGPSVCTSVFGVGAVVERAVVRDDEIVIRPILTLALCYDQRVMDGLQAADFLNKIQRLLEGGMEELECA